MSVRLQPGFSCWVLVVVFTVLTVAVALNIHLTLELAAKIDALPSRPIYRPNLPCGSIPMRLVMDDPECAQKIVLLRVLSGLGGAEALKAVRDTVGDSDADTGILGGDLRA